MFSGGCRQNHICKVKDEGEYTVDLLFAYAPPPHMAGACKTRYRSAVFPLAEAAAWRPSSNAAHSAASPEKSDQNLRSLCNINTMLCR